MLNVQDLLKLARQSAEAQQYQQAEGIYRQIVQTDPAQTSVWNLLARIAMDKGELDEAIRCLGKIQEHDPGNPEACTGLAEVYKARGEYELAEAEYWNALAINDGWDPALSALADLFSARGAFEQAAAVLGRRLAINPGNYAIANNLGVALRKAGALEDAARVFRKAASFNPWDGAAWLNLVQIEPYLSTVDIAQVEMTLKQGQVSLQSQVYLSFTLGIVYSKAKKYDQAFGYYQQGNALQRQLIDYPHDLSLAFLRSFESVFDRDFFRKRACQGDAVSSESPIFIVGMPRSGSTLVEQILATHARVYGGDETPILDQVLSSFFDVGNFVDSLAAISEEGLKAAALEYMARLREAFGDQDVITNKKLDNYLYLGVIALMFPNARVIHCKRDPLDNCLSCYMNWFSQGQYFSYDMQELGEYYRACERLMEHWKRVLPIPILDVQYEMLIEQQESVSRELLDFCGLDWDPSCMAFYNNTRSVGTISDQQVRQPIYRSSIERWRPYDQYLEPLRQGLGLVTGGY